MHEVVRIAIEAASALLFLHQKGIAHCDIKPQNLLLTSNLTVKLCDFGLSRDILAQGPGKVRGTPLYVSPEMWKDNVVTQTQLSLCDVYAFGVLLNFCATGEEPEKQIDSDFRVMTAVTTEGFRPKLPSPECGCPGGLVALIKRCWHDSPAQRPQHFSEILSELENISTSQHIGELLESK